jgi:hypothetical protein
MSLVARRVLGVLCFLAGAVWCLQGLRVLPGTFMRGSAFWAVAGAAMALLGLWLVLWPARRRPG